MLKTYLEIISQEKYKKFEKQNKQYLTSEKYKQRLEELLKRFFTNEDGKIVNTIIVPYISPNEYSITSIDKEIVDYLNNYGYICTEESYLLGYCFNNKNKEIPIVDVLKMIKQYNIKKLEQDKKDNPQYSTHYDKRIKAKQDFKENYLTYYKNFTKNRSKVIVFTWLPRAIASMSTDVGWTSCMHINIYSSSGKKVFSIIEAGAFIAWLVQRGDEEILNNPQARILIKVYVSEGGKVFWYPTKNIYGTASIDFYKKVKDFVIKKQEIHITDEDLQNIYKFDTSQYFDSSDPNQITLKTIFKKKYIKILENKIKNNTHFTIHDLWDAIQFNININLIKKILENIKNKLQEKDFENLLNMAENYNNYNIINLFLSDPSYKKLINKNVLLLYAIKINNIKVIKELLKDDVDLNFNNNNALQIAFEKGFVDIIQLLLQNKNINLNNISNDVKNYMLSIAAARGYVDIIKLLLQDPHVDPSTNNNSAIYNAIIHGHTEIVKLLLQHPNVNLSDVDFKNYALHIALEYGYIEIIKLLLQDPRVDPRDMNNYVIHKAIEYGYTEIIKLLLQDPRVNPNDNDNYILNKAIRYGRTQIVKLLLQDQRINPSDNDNYAMHLAIKNKHIDIIKLLLQDPRVRSTININNFIQLAQQNNQQEIVTLLQQYK